MILKFLSICMCLHDKDLLNAIVLSSIHVLNNLDLHFVPSG